MTVLCIYSSSFILNANLFKCCRNIFSDDGSHMPTDPAVQSAVQARNNLFSLLDFVIISCPL